MTKVETCSQRVDEDQKSEESGAAPNHYDAKKIQKFVDDCHDIIDDGHKRERETDLVEIKTKKMKQQAVAQPAASQAKDKQRTQNEESKDEKVPVVIWKTGNVPKSQLLFNYDWRQQQ